MQDDQTQPQTTEPPVQAPPGPEDSREGQGARRCQSHNRLMEPLGIVGRVAGYYCELGDDVQLRAL